jgi:D-galactarolactone cycloisomerase
MQSEQIEVINLIYQYPQARQFRHSGGVCTGRLTSLVRVATNDGKQGWGSAYSHPELTRIIIENHLRPHLLGQDPCDTEQLWQRMYGLTRWYGRKGAAMSALGALDTALRAESR